MMSKKPYIEKARTVAETKLAARVETLKTKGMSDKQIQRDTVARQFKGKIRQARHQLACIADLEQMTIRPLRESE